MDGIKLATEAQIEAIKATSDITSTSAVVAMGNDLAVLRFQVTEVDPMLFAPDSSNSRKLLFAWGIDNWLRMIGTPAYYFNVKCDDVAWQHVVETRGAERISTAPEFRYKMGLGEHVNTKAID